MDYYIKGDEKFGRFGSYIYLLFTKLPITKEFYSFVIEDLKKIKAKTIIDIGTGTGEIPIKLAKIKKVKIYAVDPSIYMINIARKHSKNLNINFSIGSSTHLNLKERFDLIFSTLSFHHWSKKRESLIYLSKFLNPNGEIRIYEFNRNSSLISKLAGSHTLSKEEIIRLAKESNMKIKIKESGNFICAILKKKSKNKK